jgi:rhomboid family GlyGly-CTERM serine protease
VESEKNLILPTARPWATIAVAALALIAFCSTRLSDLLIYRRSLILTGQLWRSWSGHIVHYGWSHLFWDLAVFVPTGIWLERFNPRCARWLYILAPLFISESMLAFDPSMERYAGLSGLASGTLVALACFQLRRKDEPVWLWWAVLALLAVKVLLELIKGAPLLVGDFKGIRNVPQAHIVGALTGAACCFLIKPKMIERPPPDNPQDILLES